MKRPRNPLGSAGHGMRSVLVFLVLVWLKLLSHVFYRHRAEWLGGRPRGWWRDLRVITILNHTSLYEVLLIGYAPLGLAWKVARHGVLPLAEKTARRPFVGRLFRSLMRHVVVVTRQRDRTWEEVLNRVDAQSLVTILPEGRMMRRDGLDSSGRPMTVRGGIADILEALHSGTMVLLYSGGLHHVQAPGELLPKLFQTIDARLELVDIPAYNRERLAEVGEARLQAGGDPRPRAAARPVLPAPRTPPSRPPSPPRSLPPERQPPAVTGRTASALLLAVTAVWGWTFVAVQDAVRAWDVIPFLAVRFAIAAVATAALWGRHLDRSALLTGLGIGSILAAGYLLQTLGLRLTSATSAGLITGLFVVVGPVADRLLYRTHLPRASLVAVAVSLVGMCLLTGGLPTALAAGDLLVLACALAFGIHVAVLSRHAPRHDPRALATAQMLACAALFLLLWSAEGPLEAPPPTVWPALLATGVVASALAYAIQTVAQRHLSAVRTAVILACEPLFAGLFGYLMAGDRLSPRSSRGAV